MELGKSVSHSIWPLVSDSIWPLVSDSVTNSLLTKITNSIGVIHGSYRNLKHLK